MKYLLGIDIGTTGTKTALVDLEGNSLAQAYQESKLHYPRQGWVEQDPADFYQGVCQTIGQVVRQAGVAPQDVAAISIDGQMAGILGVDSDFNPVTPYDSWLDNRCQHYVREIQEKAEDAVITTSGLPTVVAHCAKMLWWKNEQPETFRKVAKFVMPAAYVSGKLAGISGKDAFVDYTYVHFSGLYDFKQECWSQELCQRLGIPMEKLPRVVAPWEVVGTLTTQAAKDCGLAAGVPIVAGCGDQAAGFLGAGLVEAGSLVDVAGTASVFACCVDRFSPDVKHKTLMFCRAVSKGLWFPHAFIYGGGLCLRWFRDHVRKPEDVAGAYQFMDKQAAELPRGPSGTVFIPHLSGRNFPFDPNARGVWAGFSWNDSDVTLYKAMMESVAFEYLNYLNIERELFPETDFKEVRIIGGGKAPLFTQIKADILGLPYAMLNRDEVGVLGSALVGGFGVGLIDNMEEASKRFTHVSSRILPDMEIHRQYAPYARQYNLLYNSLAEFHAGMEQIKHTSREGRFVCKRQ